MSFLKRNKEKIIIGIVAIGLIVTIGVTSNRRDKLSKGENIVGGILTPIGEKLNALSKNFSDFFSNIVHVKDLKDENIKYKEELAYLKDQNIKYESIIARSDALKLEYDLKNQSSYNLLEATIVGKDNNNWFDRFTINKGSKDGIEAGNTIITAISGKNGVAVEGLVGRVYEVGENWSKIISIVDEDSKASFIVVRTQDGGIINGSSESNESKISGFLYDDKAEVVQGDKILTSGLGGIYKKDLLIGEVEAISDKDDMIKTISVSPAVNFKKLHKVFVILE